VLPLRKVALEFCLRKGAQCADWIKKLPPLSQPITRNTKTNRDLLAFVFLRLTIITCIALIYDSFILFFVPVVIGQNNHFGFILRHSFENRSNTKKFGSVNLVDDINWPP